MKINVQHVAGDGIALNVTDDHLVLLTVNLEIYDRFGSGCFLYGRAKVSLGDLDRHRADLRAVNDTGDTALHSTVSG
jgi:hypothetical protein